MENKILITLFLACSLVISCSKVKFNNVPSAACSAADDCVQGTDGETMTQNLIPVAPNNKVDILIIDDNSVSMKNRHASLAARFPNFIQRLNSQGINYRIAIATTDNTALPNDPQINALPQYLKDHKNGALVPFLNPNKTSSGRFFIDNNTSNAQTLFANTIQRPESIYCAQHPELIEMCMKLISGDERGIYSAIKNAQSSQFRRSDARLHVIVISDEDERSNGGGYPGLPIIDGQDRPQDFSAAAGSDATMHAIVNLPVGYNNGANFDFDSCVANQINDLGPGREQYNGCFYIQSAHRTNGLVFSINTYDYTNVLNGIAANIASTAIDHFSFNCVPDMVSLARVSGYPMPAGYNEGPVYGTPSSTINFIPPITYGTAIAVTWRCPWNH